MEARVLVGGMANQSSAKGKGREGKGKGGEGRTRARRREREVGGGLDGSGSGRARYEGDGDGDIRERLSTHRGRWQQDVCEVSLLLLDGGKREESPMSHTPLHRATVLPLNTTPRGALHPPSSPSATKNKLARSNRARSTPPTRTRTPLRSLSDCPRALALASASARPPARRERERVLPLFPPLTLFFFFFFISLLAILALALPTHLFIIRTFEPLCRRTFSRAPFALRDQATDRPTNRSIP